MVVEVVVEAVPVSPPPVLVVVGLGVWSAQKRYQLFCESVNRSNIHKFDAVPELSTTRSSIAIASTVPALQNPKIDNFKQTIFRK